MCICGNGAGGAEEAVGHQYKYVGQDGYQQPDIERFAGRRVALEDDLEYLPLGEVASFTYGYTDKAQESGTARFIRITDIDENGHLNPNDAKFVDITPENQKYLVKSGDLLMARTGATYGKTLYVPDDTPAIYASFLIKIAPNPAILLNKYYWHFAQSNLYWEQANKLVTVGGQPQFNSNALRLIEISIPPIEEQRRICDLLDRFDSMCNDHFDSLAAEIEARRQQYEYYRDKLLTFEEQ